MEIAPVLKVFLASPSDVDEERAAAQGIIRDVNRSVGSLGWRVELQVWEEVRGGGSRPQERINPLVDDCDLFVGIVWKRWGSPTGPYSSGFLEEFTRASERRRRSGRPEILIYFRRLDESECADPGPQLTEVLRYRRELESEGSILFTEYMEPTSWARRFQTDLTQWVIDFSRESRETHMAQSPGVSPAYDRDLLRTTPESDVSRVQVVELLQSVARAVESPDDGGASGGTLPRLVPGDRARLAVFAASYVADHDTGALIGAHELNLLFLSRESVHLTEIEASTLLKSLLADNDDILPGWYWHPEARFTQSKPKWGLAWYLLVLSVTARNQTVRASALRILTALESPIPKQLDRGPFVMRLLAAQGQTKGSPALRYLSAVGRAPDTDYIDAAADGLGLDKVEVATTCAHIRARSRPGQVFEQVRDGLVSRDAELDRLLLAQASRISSGVVKSALLSSDRAVRLLALHLSAKKGTIDVEGLVGLLHDESEDVRIEALLGLKERGAVLARSQCEADLAPLLDRKDWGWAKEGPAKRALFEVADAEWLESHVDWLDLDAPRAYRALALRGRLTAATVRRDVESEFSRLRAASHLRWERSYSGADSADAWRRVWRSYDQLMPNRFLGVALEVLAEIGDRSDATLARRALGGSTESVVRRGAVRLLAETATRRDVGLLASAAEAAMGQTRELAIRTVMRLSRGSRSCTAQLLQSNNAQVVVLALDACPRNRAEWAKPMARKSLCADDAETRAAGARLLAEASTREELLELLSSYSTQVSYHYYDVVCWLDRHLYAPEPLHDYYEAAFKARASPRRSDFDDAIDL